MGKVLRTVITVSVTIGCAYAAIRVGIIASFALRFILDRQYYEILEVCRHQQSCSINEGSILVLRIILSIISSPLFYYGLFGILGGLMGWAVISKLLKK